MVDTDVLIVGAGPVGLTAAAELRRQRATCRIIDKLPARLPYVKPVGVQPRTLEVWDRMGMVRAALEAAVPMRGQLMYADGVEQAHFELRLPPGVPYAFAALPQYETERIIEEHLARFGTGIERGTELLGFTRDEDGVVSRIVRARTGRRTRAGLPPVTPPNDREGGACPRTRTGGWHLPPPRCGGAPAKLVRTAVGCRGSRRSCGGPSSCDVASRTSNLLFPAFGHCPPDSRPVTTRPLSSRRDGKHTRCGCTRVAYITVVARLGRVVPRQSARTGCVRFAPVAGSNTWALAMSTRRSTGSPSRARVAAFRRATR